MATPFRHTLGLVVAGAPSGRFERAEVLGLREWVARPESKLHAIRHGLVQAALSLAAQELPAEEGAPPPRAELMRLLADLATLRQGREALLPAGLDCVLAAVRDPEAEVRAEACRLLQVAARFHESNRLLCRDGLAKATLIELLAGEGAAEDRVAHAALSALAELSQYDMAARHETVALMVRLLRRFEPPPAPAGGEDGDAGEPRGADRAEQELRAEAGRHALQYLWNVTADESNKELAIAEDVAAALAPQLGARHASNRRRAAGVLALITTALRGKEAVAGDAALVEALAGLASPATPADLRENVILTIRNVVESPRGRAAFGRALAPQPAVACEIMGFGRVAKVVEALLREAGGDRKAESLALDVLEFLVRTDEGAHAAAVNCLEVVLSLCDVAVRRQDDAHATLICAECLVVLCSSHDQLRKQLLRRVADDDKAVVAVAYSSHARLQEMTDVWSRHVGGPPSAGEISLRRRQLKKARDRAKARDAVRLFAMQERAKDAAEAKAKAKAEAEAGGAAPAAATA